ncbi:response regulator transcription factor [Sphingosinicella sp. BN140058]|uniref:response regulator transcription factor n=1 Tax=Sphingosinicella sp. BN140058 TaxID=1892855 RepID=UPI001011A290|nr:response regulator [Sphingosinicella sp. BN140058]QAY78722.1 response regulator transcription factor [Sphingosinicella sp. BN140058]
MSENGRIVHLVDDDEAIRRSASFMLRTSGFLVKTYPSGVPMLELGRDIAPGVILMDVRMPEMDGLEVQKALRDNGVFLPVIVMTGHGDIGIAVEAMKGGAVDFIEKPFEKATMIAALEEGFARLEQSGRRRARAEEAKARLKVLTGREVEILEGLVRGHPNKTIAYDLGISPRTVEIHRANVMQKLEVPSLSDALRIAFAAGLGDDAEVGDEAQDA